MLDKIVFSSIQKTDQPQITGLVNYNEFVISDLFLTLFLSMYINSESFSPVREIPPILSSRISLMKKF